MIENCHCRSDLPVATLCREAKFAPTEDAQQIALLQIEPTKSHMCNNKLQRLYEYQRGSSERIANAIAIFTERTVLVAAADCHWSKSLPLVLNA